MSIFKPKPEVLPIAVLAKEGYSVFSFATRGAAFTIYTKVIDERVESILRAWITSMFHHSDDEEPFKPGIAKGGEGYA